MVRAISISFLVLMVGVIASIATPLSTGESFAVTRFQRESVSRYMKSIGDDCKLPNDEGGICAVSTNCGDIVQHALDSAEKEAEVDMQLEACKAQFTAREMTETPENAVICCEKNLIKETN